MRATLILVLCLSAAIVQADTLATQMINQLRSDAGAAPLKYSVTLEEAARAHALDMASGTFFAHEGRDGSNVADRVSRTGYTWCYVAENIAQGQRSLDEVMAGWEGSEGHRRNMLRRGLQDFAVVAGPNNLWVMVLAASDC